MNLPQTPRVRLAIAIAFVAFWMAALCASPLMRVSWKLAGWPDWRGIRIVENRGLAEKPDLRATPVKQWGGAVEAWYNDSLPWRAWLIQRYRDFHFKGLKTAVLQQVPGEGAWVFRRGGSWPELDDYLGAFELTPEEHARFTRIRLCLPESREPEVAAALAAAPDPGPRRTATVWWDR